MPEVALEEWLRGTKAVEVEQRHGVWNVWVTNGLAGDDREGAWMATCPDQLHAELVAEALRRMAT